MSLADAFLGAPHHAADVDWTQIMSQKALDLEVALPVALSHAWVAFACQKSSLPRPRWDHEVRVWTSGPLLVVASEDRRKVRVAAPAAGEEVLRTFVSALVTGMMQRARARSGSLAR